MALTTILKANLARSTNAMLWQFDVAMVRASTLRRTYEIADAEEPPRLLVPASAEAELMVTNPRLVELQRIYRGMNEHPIRMSSLWTEDFTPHINLLRFRSHNAYLWQEALTLAQKLHWLLVGYDTTTVDRLGLLDRMTEDGTFGVNHFRFMNRYTDSKDLLDSVNEIAFRERAVGISNMLPLRVLEIGAGYGRLMHRLVEAWPQGGTGYCVDTIPESTFLSESYTRFRGLSDRVTVVSLHKIDEAFADVRVDVVTNVHSFSECCLAAVQLWLDLAVRVGTKYLFIVPNAITTAACSC
jgi:hypothetical protein